MLVIGADALSRYVDWSDRGTCILFGDGAGAVVLRVRQEGGVLLQWLTDQGPWDHTHAYGGGF